MWKRGRGRRGDGGITLVVSVSNLGFLNESEAVKDAPFMSHLVTISDALI